MSSEENTNTLISLTQEEVLQLKSLLISQDRSVPARRTPKAPLVGEKKIPSKWPEWNGAKESYSTYIDQLAAKIEVDWKILGGHKAVCNDMMNTIPTFIDHFNENFEDKTSVREASLKLNRMRQGMHQSFASFLNDFEYMLAQADRLRWEGHVKVTL